MADTEFVAPQASPVARQYIAKGRIILYAPKMKPAVQAAMTGTQSLADGIAAFVVQMMHKLEEKMGDLSEDDYRVVVAHLVGSMVDMAKTLGEPEASQNPQQIVKDAVAKVIQMDMQNAPQQPQDAPQDPSQAPPQAPQGTLPQFGGAQ